MLNTAGIFCSDDLSLCFFPPLLQNLNQNPRTLLPKFYGLYCVQSGGKNIRVVVMNNILPRVVKMHLKFDLKGSTYKRRASKKEKEKSSPTYKDLDFIQDMPEGLMLDADTFSALVKTLQRDCLVRMGQLRDRVRNSVALEHEEEQFPIESLANEPRVGSVLSPALFPKSQAVEPDLMAASED